MGLFNPQKALQPGTNPQESLQPGISCPACCTSYAIVRVSVRLRMVKGRWVGAANNSPCCREGYGRAATSDRLVGGGRIHAEILISTLHPIRQRPAGPYLCYTGNVSVALGVSYSYEYEYSTSSSMSALRVRVRVRLRCTGQVYQYGTTVRPVRVVATVRYEYCTFTEH